MVWRALCALGLPCRLVKGQDIANGALFRKPCPQGTPGKERGAAPLLLVPGGNARLKARALGEKGRQAVRDYLAEGGRYLGFCGGAGLALAYTCAMQHCERLTLAGRSEEKLQSLKDRLNSFFIDEHRLEGASDRLAAHLNNTPRFNAAVAEADLIVNATSLGLKPTDPSPVPPTLLSAHHLVYDLQTHDDTFQMEARFQGARVSNGLSMLVHQGALSFERWFGIKPDISAMRQALEQKHA